MNTLKLQQDLIKAAFNRDKKGKMFNGVFLKRDYDMLVGFNGSAIYTIYNDELYIDCEKVFAGRSPQNFENVINGVMDSKDYELLTNTNTIEQHIRNKKKLNLVKFKNSKYDIYIDKNLLKYFDMDALVLYGGTDKQPIRVYENETFVGIVCPTWIQKD